MDDLNEERILVPWKNLFRKYKGVSYYSGENHRSFRAWTGCSPFVCEKIFRKYQNPDYLPDRSRLIIALNYMKSMPTEDEGATSFKITRKTYRKYVWDVLFYLDYFMNEINIDYRFRDPLANAGLFQDITLIVDGTDCPIHRPGTREQRNIFTNGRNKENISGYNLKYTIACQISTGRICWIGGPDPGSMPDIGAVKDSSLLVSTFADSDEILLADKGYQGQPRMLTPFKGSSLSPDEAAFNEILASVRILVECVIKRIKNFGTLGSPGRFRSSDHEKHSAVFRVACQVTNITLEEEPIWSHSNFYLR